MCSVDKTVIIGHDNGLVLNKRHDITCANDDLINWHKYYYQADRSTYLSLDFTISSGMLKNVTWLAEACSSYLTAKEMFKSALCLLVTLHYWVLRHWWVNWWSFSGPVYIKDQ